MGVARLLAKGWIVFCLYAGAHAVLRAFGANIPVVLALQQIGVCVALFGAMGLLFIGGYGAASTHPLLERFRPDQLAPGFNEIVFIVFACACFFMQSVYAPAHLTGPVTGGLEAAIRFAVPGQRALEGGLAVCGLDGGRTSSSAFAWVLAFIFLGSALSRVRLAAAIVRLERKNRAEPLGATTVAFILGVASLVGFQLLYMGTGFGFIPCSILSGVLGEVLIGIGPLFLAYLILAALTDLLALGDEA